jgi:chemotaxis protein methyltransferase CheR
MAESALTRDRARAQALELLGQRHGVGVRGSEPAWLELRLDRALDALAGDTGDLNAALERLRSDAQALGEVADVLRVGETRFYRDPAQWEALRRRVLPALDSRERVRALSAGCSTGEEAWTLAMLLAELGAPFRVVGIDRSEVALATARDGTYSPFGARHLPSELASRYLDKRPDSVRVAEELRPSVSFVPRDVMQGPPPGNYEIIVCKNVLIYFGDEAGEHAVGLMLRALADRGVLLVARSEVPRLRAMGHRAEEIAPGVVGFRAG